MILVWELLVGLCTPVLVLGALLSRRLRVGLRARLGFPQVGVEPGAVWIHAASIGEGRAASALIRAIRDVRPDLGVVRSFSSDAGAADAAGADQAIAAPLDSPLCAGPWLDRVRPRCLILVEAELWPCLLAACRRRRIPVAVVNARLGPGFHRLRRLGLWGALSRGVSFVAADAPTAGVLGGLVTGDLKAEAPFPPAVLTWSRPAVVAGSTHPGEEQMLLAATATLSPRPLLILAPRDPERFDAVATLLDGAGVAWVRRTRCAGAVPSSVEVVLLDTLGELAGLYPGADAAFVGGTFQRDVGGHSPSEPKAAGLPVVAGPHTHANLGAWEGVRAFHAVTPLALRSALAAALAAGRVPVAGAAAAVATVEVLTPWLDAPTPPEPWQRGWLVPLVPFWQLGVWLRPGRPRRAALPVILVGALTAGGTGKTPVAGFLAERLAARQPCVVGRGYRRSAGRDVRTRGEASELGDELTMLARRGVQVVSSPDRHAGIAAAAREGSGVVVLDDGWMDPTLSPDLTVVVVDARWPEGGGPIPVGTRRVPLGWLARADVVWVNHGALPGHFRRHLRPDAVVVEARYRPVGWLFRGKKLPLDALPDRHVAAFAGIARPEGFFHQLRQLGCTLIKAGVFPDHHVFRWSDLQSIEAWTDDHVVVTTEKDAARLPRDAGVYVLCVAPEIVHGAEALDTLLRRFDGSA